MASSKVCNYVENRPSAAFGGRQCRKPLPRHNVNQIRRCYNVCHKPKLCLLVVRSKPESDISAQEIDLLEETDFDLLSDKVKDLTKELDTELRGCSIYLIGMMGSGKSTVGKMLANTLKYAFFDTDQMIESVHEQRRVADIFKEFGEEYFRNCETQVLKQLAPYKNLVIATGGGAVLKPMNWSYMHQGVVTWLHGDTALLARRVIKDGAEKRPLLLASVEGQQQDATTAIKSKLDSILLERTKFYTNADVIVSLDGVGENLEQGAPTAVVMYRVMKAIHKKVMDTKEEREAKKNYIIENATDISTMRQIQIESNGNTAPSS